MITAHPHPRALPRIDQLREEFDRSFARAPDAAPAARAGFLGIRVGGDPYAIGMAEIASLHRDRKLVPLIDTVPELLGIAGFRGKLAPVYDLGLLLGYAGATAPRWLVLARAPSPVGLAFDLYESHLTAVREEIIATRTAPGAAGGPRGDVLNGIVTAGDAARPIISISSILEEIVRRFRRGGPEKER